jgi:hypothetical protein
MMGFIKQYVLSHPAVLIAVIGFAGTAFSSTLPEKRPKTMDDWWQWARDFVHQIANARRPAPPKETQ